MKIVVVTMVSMMLLMGCAENSVRGFFVPYSMNLEPPAGPPEYQQGWRDGCESGLSAYGGQVEKFLKVHKLKRDPVLQNNKVYYQVWKDAFLYCTLYMESSRKLGI